jgi:hypothetical protein
LYALVTGLDKQVGAEDGWRIAFVPGKDMPAGLAEERWYAAVDRNTGWPRKYLVTRAKTPTREDLSLRAFGTASLSIAAPEGVPIEFIPPSSDAFSSQSTLGETLTLRKEVKGSNVTMVATITASNKERLRVVQRWVSGEKWWREYERYVDGSKSPSARREVPLDGGQHATKPPASELRSDPRLQAQVTIEGTGLDFQNVLLDMQAQTGIAFTLDPNLADHRPQLGSIQLRRARVFAVMEFLAQVQMDEGRWERTAGGYKLSGRTKVPADYAPVRREEPPKPPETRPHTLALWLWGIGATHLAFLLAVVAWRLHRRSSKEAA